MTETCVINNIWTLKILCIAFPAYICVLKHLKYDKVALGEKNSIPQLNFIGC